MSPKYNDKNNGILSPKIDSKNAHKKIKSPFRE